MKLTTCKRLLFALLAILLCLSTVACSKEANTTTETLDAQSTQAAPEKGNQGESPIPVPMTEEEQIDNTVNEIPDDELLGKIGAWRGWSNSGTLSERDQYVIKTIKSKKDLDPYRPYLTNFTAADEKTILADTGGTCVLVELTAATENTLYGTSSITQAGNAITICVSVDEVEDVLPKYTFFLLYFPQKYYNGEIIDLSF